MRLLFALTLALSGAFGIDPARNAVSLNFYDEPQTLDPQRATDRIAMTILGHAGEGLVRLDPASKPVPAQAASWEVTDKTSYVFKLRENVAWSDGKPVTAADFVYGWQRAADPATGAGNAFLLHALKNGRAVTEGTKAPAELGVKALDERTLAVTLERPTEFFLRLLSMATFQPARRDFVEQAGGLYATEAGKLLSNGPFVVASWVHGTSLVLKKNEAYWNKGEIHLDEISMPAVVRDKAEEFRRFKDGQFSLTWSLSKEAVAEAEKAKIQVRKYNHGTVWYLQLNTKRGATASKSFRKALQLAMNREQFVKDVQGISGSRPIYGIVPDYMPGVSKRYGEEYPLAFPDAQIKTARALLEAAKAELGVKELPAVTVLANDTVDTRRDMEYFKKYFKETLGLEMKLDFAAVKERLERTERRDFDVVNAGWGPDYLDAMTYADLFTSWNKHNATGWTSADYDALIDKATQSVDAKVRLDAVSAAEKILVEEAPIVPYFQQYRVYVQDPRLIGVLRRTVGADPDFYYAKIMKPVASK